MKVVLDSNIIIADFLLDSPSSKTLLESSKSGKIEIFIPQVVLDEVHNKFRERLEDAKGKIDKEYVIIKKLTQKALANSFTDEDVAAEALAYTTRLAEIFKNYNGAIIPYPLVSHQRIAHKAIRKTKPFNASEKGYRDALIWENVKSLIPEVGINPIKNNIIFITGNKRDFCSNEADLHQDLFDELHEGGLDETTIKVFNSTDSFANEIAKLFFEQSFSFKEKLEGKEIENFDFEELLTDALRDELDKTDLSEIDAIPYSDFDTTIRYIEKIFELAIGDVRKLNAVEYLVEVTCKAEMEIDFFMEKSYHYSSEDKGYSVEDADWNKHVIWASAQVEPELNISVILDSDEMSISSLQIN